MKGALTRFAYESVLRPGLFRACGSDPEKIHEVMIKLLGNLAATPVAPLASLILGQPQDPVTIAGVRFPGRVGVAAGLDKDGVAARMWSHLGFGFAELGTVTAQAQPGNPRPRVFRLVNSHGLINRMGFNNHGAQALADRLAGWGVRRGQRTLGIPLGISIGKTKIVDLDHAVSDYVSSLSAVHQYADYVAVNVSSPNTPGLRSLQGRAHIHDLVTELVTTAAKLDPNPLPIFVKLAPDLSDSGVDELIEAVVDAGGSGLIATNTTQDRRGIARKDMGFSRQEGGMSGRPLRRRARQVVAQAVSSKLPVIASGGIMSVADAEVMFDLGAQAVQVYTGFIYSGPGLVAGINALKEKHL